MKTHLKHQLKVIVGVLLLACFLRIKLDAQTSTPTPVFNLAAAIKPASPEKGFGFCGGVAGCWLIIERHNHRDDPKAFDPSMTSIVCDFKPIATKLANGKWEITFISDLPNPPP